MAVANPSFETAGASAGLAASWTFTTTVTTEELAEYGTVPAPWDTFGAEWGNEPHLTEFEASDLEAPEYENGTVLPDDYDGFETHWNNVPHLTELGQTETALFDTVQTVERFEAGNGWDATYKSAFTGVGVDLTAALFSGNAYENFEAGSGWDATYKSAFTGIGTDLTAALFNYLSGGSYQTEAVDGFERTKPFPQHFTVDPTTDVVFVPVAHTLAANDEVVLVAGTGQLPAPLNEVDVYAVQAAGATTLALYVNAALVDITDHGTGVDHTVRVNPAYYWNLDMETI